MKAFYRTLLVVLITIFHYTQCFAQSETLSTGSFIINMGATNPNTIANGLKPYGLIYDLLRNYKVPVKWVIGAGKVKDGVDFTYNATSFRGGTFIIPAEFRSAAVNARISFWQGKGVVGVTTTSPLTVTVTQTLVTFPRWTLDAQNGDIAEEYLINAGISNADFPGAYNWKLPAQLDLCDDFFVMPHADPTWANHGNLLQWNKNALGSIWAACHAVSALENCINPSDPTQQMNFLSTRTSATTPLPYPNNSLTLWNSHADGTPPYTNQFFDDPVTQFMGSPDLAMTNGSEQIFLPKQNASPNNTRWRPGVKFLSYDPTQANIPSPDIANGNVAAAMIYGRAFDDPTRGYVMYMAGHSHNKGSVADVAAQRAFLNFSIFQAQAKSFQIASLNLTNGQQITTGSTIPVSVNIVAPQAGATFTYAWSSSCGGSFANPNAASTSFTAPVVTGPTPCIITCEVTDNCGRKSFNAYVVIICNPTVSGNVFDDADGLNDAVIDGPGTNAGGLFAVLINQSGNVVSVTNVDNTGAYSFSDVFPGNYSILISTTSPSIGAPAPSPSLPAGWVNTGEGTTASGDGNVNGQTSIFTVGFSNITGVNFGINQVPTANPVTATSQVNPGGTTQVTVPVLTGSDPEDGTYTGVSGTNTIIIQTLPSNGTLYYNGTPVTAGQTISNYNPSLLTLDPGNGAITVTFTYSEVDAAGTASAAATVSMGFFTVCINGNVFDDANGLTDAIVNGTGTNAGGLNAVLLSGSTVTAVVAVNPDGTFSFPHTDPGTYSVLITTANPNVGDPAPAATLPSGWVNTGEGTTASGDGNVNGQTNTFTLGSSNISGVNFGINQVPTADAVTATSQVNPGGTTQVTVPVLTGSDPEDGAYTGVSGTNTIIIQTLPSNGTLYYNGVPVTAGQTITNYDPTLLTLDPDNGAITVTFTYSEVDAAGTPSAAATVSMGFFTVGISGNVFDDANGLTDNTVNGTGTNAGGLNAILLNGTTVVAITPVNNDGTFSFATTDPGTYSVLISTASPNVGDPAPVSSLPSGWVNTGEGTTAAGDGNINGQTNTFTISSSSISGVNFGINQVPTADPVTATSQVNPGGTTQVTVPVLTGSDPEDGTYTGVSGTNTIIIQTLPSNGTLYYNGTPVTTGQTISNYDPSLLTLDPDNGAITVTFTYSEVDAAGVASTPNTVVMPFTTVNISGNVFNDVDGMTDGVVDGAGTNAGGLNAILLDGTTVVDVVAVAPDGKYSFSSVNGGTYSVMISTASPSPLDPACAVTLPSGWVNTGEGTMAAGDGNANGQTNTFTVSSTDITDVNFGIEQLPTPLTITAPGQENPEGTNQVIVPPSTFGGTDPSGGIITSIIITSFPTNVTSIIINGTTYTSITFPPGGVQVPTNASGEPTQSISIDPNDGLVIVDIPYVVIDNGGQTSVTTGSAIIPFTTTVPITLLNFDAVKNGNEADLKWTTTQEVNSSHFEIERSTDGRHFNMIGRTQAAGYSNTSRSYSYKDSRPDNGLNYYRLKLVDRDGSYSYSQVRMLKFDKEPKLEVFPNPATTYVNISFPADWIGKDATIEMFNNAGQRVNRMLLWDLMQTFRIRVDNLPNGTYHLKIYQQGMEPEIRSIQLIK